MVNRKNYSSNNRAICGTKMVAVSNNLDGIFTRFGDVTINSNQLQIKTGKIVEDIDKVWNWSKNVKHIDMPKQTIFDNNNGKGFIFPPEIKYK